MLVEYGVFAVSERAAARRRAPPAAGDRAAPRGGEAHLALLLARQAAQAAEEKEEWSEVEKTKRKASLDVIFTYIDGLIKENTLMDEHGLTYSDLCKLGIKTLWNERNNKKALTL